MNKKVLVTTGDPAGCGPYISLKAVERVCGRNIDILLVGDKPVLERLSLYKRIKTKIRLIDAGNPDTDKIEKGKISPAAGMAALSYLKKALEVIRREKIKAMVTAPVSKESIQSICPGFRGHTEYLAGAFESDCFAMMMVSRDLKIVLLTRHVPLRMVPRELKKGDLKKVILMIRRFLKNKFKIVKPKIVLCSVNPHAGIDTFLDREEAEFKPVLDGLQGLVSGPYPSDSVFTPENLSKYDCVLCPYHDQGMIPFKLICRRRGVNLTLGLPVIRTSPAHGVAFDAVRAGKRIFSSSMEEAVKLAVSLT